MRYNALLNLFIIFYNEVVMTLSEILVQKGIPINEAQDIERRIPAKKIDLAKRLIEHGDYLTYVLHYIFFNAHSPAPEEMIELLIQAIPERRGEIMTIVEMCEQQGRDEGILLGKLKVAKRLIKNCGFDNQTIADLTELPLETIQEISHQLKLNVRH